MNDNEVDRQRLKSALGAVAAQDRTAMRLIYDQTADKLFAVCLRVLKDTAAAEDTLQDVYLKV